MTELITVKTVSNGEIEEKKSRFLACLTPVKTEEEAVSFIESVRKKHYDARHVCFAYIIAGDVETVKQSDDGEPQKTAGQPILSVLTGAGLKNVCCTVTRYFGGTLLGTGGLVRAYTDAAKAALDAAVLIKKVPGIELVIRSSYNDAGKIQYYLNSENITIAGTDYADDVTITVNIEAEKCDALEKKLTDLTSAKAVIERSGDIIIDSEVSH